MFEHLCYPGIYVGAEPEILICYTSGDEWIATFGMHAVDSSAWFFSALLGRACDAMGVTMVDEAMAGCSVYIIDKESRCRFVWDTEAVDFIEDNSIWKTNE